MEILETFPRVFCFRKSRIKENGGNVCSNDNPATVRPAVKPDSSLASSEMKTYSKSIVELRNVQILQKKLEKSSQFFSS